MHRRNFLKIGLSSLLTACGAPSRIMAPPRDSRDYSFFLADAPELGRQVFQCIMDLGEPGTPLIDGEAKGVLWQHSPFSDFLLYRAGIEDGMAWLGITKDQEFGIIDLGPTLYPDLFQMQGQQRGEYHERALEPGSTKFYQSLLQQFIGANSPTRYA